jgi:hypothetical protein
MKKKLLFISACLVLSSFAVFAQFTAGNIVVYRYGTGAAALSTVNVPVFLDEYTPAGVLVKTWGVPSTTNGSNIRLTGLPKAGTVYQQEGMSVLSQDGKYITIVGSNAAIGGTVGSSTTTGTPDAIVVGIIAADGSYNSTTTLSNGNTFGIPRSAIINGTDIYVNGNGGSGVGGSVQYLTLGATSSTRITPTTGQNSPRTIGVFNNTLYVPFGGSQTSLAFANPLPTTSSVVSSNPFATTQTITSTGINQMAIVTVGTTTIMYVANDAVSTGVIQRYYLNGSVWTALGSTISDATNTQNLKGIIAKTTVDVGLGTTTVSLFTSTWGDTGAGVLTSKISTFTDVFVTATPTAAPTTSTLTKIIDAPTNTVFRSVTFAPQGSSAIGTGVLPIKLTSFSGQKQVDAIQLNWTTASEKNNSHFDILRSIDGKKFLNIGKVAGKGNSDAKVDYTFLDQNPLGGTNYYQLNQVDFDGQSSKSDVKAVESGIKTTELTVYANKNTNEVCVSIFSANATTADFKIFDISGRELLNKSISLNKGYNSFNLPLQLGNGVFVTTLKTPVETISKKFINQ